MATRRLTPRAALKLKPAGIEIESSGFTGNVEWYGKRSAGTRGATGEQDDLVEALADADLEDRHTLLLDGQAAEGATLKITVPAATDELQYALVQAEDDSLRFCYPQQDQASATGNRSTTTEAHYEIPLPKPVGQSGVRGLLAKTGKFAIKFVVTKLVPVAAGRFVCGVVGWWEERNRKFQGFHGGSFAELLSTGPQKFAQWNRLSAGRALLLIHGTTSSTAGAFQSLADFPAVQSQLTRLYGDRILGFNHHTMGRSVAENVRQFWQELPAGTFEFDVVTHSRGGLVARALTHLPSDAMESWQRPTDRVVNIRRVVFVGTPNAGTVLAVPDRLPGFIEWTANLIARFPDSVGTIALSALLALASSVAERGMATIPGLVNQQPDSQLLHALKDDSTAVANYFGIAADYGYGKDSSLLRLFENIFMDHAFTQEANDLVVPTGGVSAPLRLPSNRCHQFQQGDGVHHTNFFANPRTWDQIVDFLSRQ